MSAEENKAVARRFFGEVWGKGNLAVADELVAADYRFHDPSDPDLPPGPEGAKRMAAAFRAAFPDLEVTEEDYVAEGARVAYRWAARGTHLGELFGIPATGKRVAFTGIEFLRLEGGKLAEHWDEVDVLGLLQQLGALPAPAGPSR
jgi:steroid delta-isomerase-like uncharacterized protein